MAASIDPVTGAIPDPDVCPKEPIHIPGAIEPAGVMLIVVLANLDVLDG